MVSLLTGHSTSCQNFPIMLCLGLTLNYDILGYGMNEETLKRTNATLQEVFENASYILNRDFNITFGPKNNNFKPFSIKEGKNEYIINANKSWVAEVEKIRTMQYATCYKIEPKVTKGATIPFHLHLNVTQFVNEGDQNKGFYLLLTGNNTWTGITRAIWPQFKPTKIYIPFDYNYHELKARDFLVCPEIV